MNWHDLFDRVDVVTDIRKSSFYNMSNFSTFYMNSIDGIVEHHSSARITLWQRLTVISVIFIWNMPCIKSEKTHWGGVRLVGVDTENVCSDVVFYIHECFTVVNSEVSTLENRHFNRD